MTAETYSLLAWIFWGVSGAFLITGIILFFVLKIPAVIGDLSGRTAQKSINKMWDKTDKKTAKANKAKAKKAASSTVTVRKTGKGKNEILETGLLVEDSKPVAAVVEETELLTDIDGTVALGSGDTETESLTDARTEQPRRAAFKRLEVIEEILIVHTQEHI